MKRKLFGFVEALIVLMALGLVLAGCEFKVGEHATYDPIDVTVTIKNTTSGELAVNFKGIYVEIKQINWGENSSDTKTYPIGGNGTYDATYTLAPGASKTLPTFKLPLDTGNVAEGNYATYRIFGDIEKATSNTMSISDIFCSPYEYLGYAEPTVTVNLELAPKDSDTINNGNYILKEVN